MALLAFLAIALPRGFHRRDKLLAVFWPELDEPHARNSLSQALHVLRTTLGEGAIVTRGDDEVGIARDIVRSDVAAFETALDRGHPAEALLLYRGDLLDGFFVSSAPEFERWLEVERARFRQRASAGGWDLARMKANQGDLLEAEQYARSAANLLLPDETQVRQLMTFLHGLGDRSAAIRAYDEFAHRLVEEYELEPSAETRALAGTIRQNFDLAADTGETVSRFQPSYVQIDTLPDTHVASKTATQPRKRRWSRSLFAVLVLSVASTGIAFSLRARAAEKLRHERRVPRLVVLSLQNLGAPANAYFAEGISDEISTRLATTRGLDVIGGASAQRYKTATDLKRRRLDGQGADYVLEGTASWMPSPGGRGHVRVRLRLANAHDGAELWGTVLDEDITAATELFALYSSVAQRVVDELDIVLETPPQRAATTIPTTSLEAYNDYLRGRDYLRRTSTAINFGAAIQSLERAVERDTNFALAFALLTNAHTEAVWLGGMDREHLKRAKVAGERALRLDPQLPEGHAYLGWYYYVCCEDYGRAMWHLTKSHAIRPGDAQVVMFIGNVHKRQGHWAESIRYFEDAVRLDPLARWPRNNLGHAQLWSRRYDDAERTFRRVIASEPQDVFAYAHLAMLLVLRNGDIPAARRVVDEARRSSDGFAEMRMPYYLDVLDRNYDAALARLQKPGPGFPASLLNEWLVSDKIRRGLVLRLRGDTTAARAQFDSARTELETALRTAASESRRLQLWLRSGLAITYAGLGRRTDAMGEVSFVMESDPLNVDAIEGPKYLQHVALAHILLGNRSAAIDVLERLLSVGSTVSRQTLRLEPFWDQLKNESRFARLIRDRS